MISSGKSCIQLHWGLHGCLTLPLLLLLLVVVVAVVVMVEVLMMVLWWVYTCVASDFWTHKEIETWVTCSSSLQLVWVLMACCHKQLLSIMFACPWQLPEL